MRRKTKCSQCSEPIKNTPIMADGKPYCSKLCVAMAMILDVHKECDLSEGEAREALEVLIDWTLDGKPKTPVTTHYSDALDCMDDLYHGANRKECIVVPVGNDLAKVDWVPAA